jgi:ATP-dependent Lhr-like helicase
LTGEVAGIRAVIGADPIDLVGTLLPGAKVPALTGNRVLYRNGVPVAALVGSDIRWIEKLEGADAVAAESMLVQRRIGSPLLAYLR